MFVGLPRPGVLLGLFVKWFLRWILFVVVDVGDRSIPGFRAAECCENPLKTISAEVMTHVYALYSATEAYYRYIEC